MLWTHIVCENVGAHRTWHFLQSSTRCSAAIWYDVHERDQTVVIPNRSGAATINKIIIIKKLHMTSHDPGARLEKKQQPQSRVKGNFLLSISFLATPRSLLPIFPFLHVFRVIAYFVGRTEKVLSLSRAFLGKILLLL